MPYKDKEREREYRKNYREKHKDELKKYAQENKEYLNSYRKEWRQNNPDKSKASQGKYYRTDKGRFNAAQNAAQKRGKSFNISFERYRQIISEPCYFCNNELGDKSTTGSGLDRIDNAIGYESNNVKSCCWTCNKIKNDTLTSQETKVAVDAILKFRESLSINEV